MRKVIPVDPNHPERRVLQEIAALIHKGGVVAIPTDTFYGLAADPFDADAVRRLFTIKGRAYSKPILLLIADRAMLSPLIEEIPPIAEKLIDAFWPGPLTLVFQASKRLSPLLTGGSGKIGVRLPSAPLPLQLIQTVGIPITATSANRSGDASPASAQEVEQTLGESVDAILDGGPCTPLPSTVLDVTVTPPRIVREGRVSAAQLAAIIE
ncbi:MAG: threonylcarbamoyl-AMP synthase [Nitrospirae bacterium]|nr:threonylcarbamoyl-AMP synthase [Candidatus Manganitrophaceae bacterium]